MLLGLSCSLPARAQQDHDWNWSNDVFQAPAFHENAVTALLKEPKSETQQVFTTERLPNVVVTWKSSEPSPKNGTGKMPEWVTRT